MYAVVGLGNPGVKYQNTRHNIGFDIVNALASRFQIDRPSKAKYHGLISEGSIQDQKTILLLPQTFMNVSGRSVASAMTAKRFTPQQCIVIHDELALPFGTIRCKNGGGHGGHNGLRDISQSIGTDYLRVRFGVGQPPAGWDTARYVLSRFTRDESTELELLISTAIDCIEAIVTVGVDAAMNTFNVRQT